MPMTDVEAEELVEYQRNRRHSRRQLKRIVKGRLRRLPIGSYAFGCRGHPTRVVKKHFHPGELFGADCDLESLVDGVVESCSIYHCNPEPIGDAYALEYADYMKRHGKQMAEVKFHPAFYDDMEKTYRDPDFDTKHASWADYRVGKSLQEFLGLDDASFIAYQTREFPD